MIFLCACGPSPDRKEEIAAIDEIDQLIAAGKAEAEALIKAEANKTPINSPMPYS